MIGSTSFHFQGLNDLKIEIRPEHWESAKDPHYVVDLQGYQRGTCVNAAILMNKSQLEELRRSIEILLQDEELPSEI